MDDSRAKSVSQLLSAFFDEKTLQRGEKYAEFSRSWRSIAGDRLADHSKPSDIRHGVLLIETDHSGWIQLLQLKQERILAEIVKRYPELEIHGLAFRIGYGEGDKRTAVVDAPTAGHSPNLPASSGQSERAEPESQAAEMQHEAEPPHETAQPERSEGESAGKSEEKSKLPDFLLKKFEHIRKNIEKR